MHHSLYNVISFSLYLRGSSFINQRATTSCRLYVFVIGSPVSPFCLLQPLLGQSGQCGLCVRGTLGHGGPIMTASSAHSPPAAGVFIFRLTLKHKAIHHRAPLPPRPRPRDTAPRYEDTRPGAAASITAHTELSGGNKPMGDSVQKRLLIVVVRMTDSTDWCATL